MGSNLGSSRHRLHRRPGRARAWRADHPLRYAVAYVDDPYGREVGRRRHRRDPHARHGPGRLVPYDADHGRLRASWPPASPRSTPTCSTSRPTSPTASPCARRSWPSTCRCWPTSGRRRATACSQFGQPARRRGGRPVRVRQARRRRREPGRARRPRAGPPWPGWRPTVPHRYHEDMPAPALSGFSAAYALFVHVLPGRPRDTPPACRRRCPGRAPRPGTLANGSGMDLRPARLSPTPATTAPPPASSGSGWRPGSGPWCGRRPSPTIPSPCCRSPRDGKRDDAPSSLVAGRRGHRRLPGGDRGHGRRAGAGSARCTTR